MGNSLVKLKKIIIGFVWPKLPKTFQFSIGCFRILNNKFGYKTSVIKGLPLDAENNPIPWYTYPAIEFLNQFDYSDKTVFEWGGGNSSLFWSRRAQKIFTVDNDKEWADKIKSESKNGNLEIRWIDNKDKYIGAIHDLSGKFDLIIIDGKFRSECANTCLSHLKEGGLIILDNSDWYPKTAKRLKSCGLLQIDFSGFGPCNNYTWTTSLFFSRNFNFKTVNENQPVHSLGSIKQYAE